jgi:hypothetical protein
MLAGRRWCHGRDGGVILIESQGNGAPTQEASPQVFPAGIFSVCVWSRQLLMWLLLLMFTFVDSKSDFLVAGVVPRQL